MKKELLRAQCEMLNAAISKVTSLYGVWAKKHGLSYNSLMVLYTMEDESCRTQKDICEKWMLPKTTVNTILAEFRAKGYITFASESRDKREKTIELTTAGREYSSSILPALHELETRVLGRMGTEQREALVNGNVLFGEYFEREVAHE